MSTDQPDSYEAQPIINIVGEKVALGPLHRGLMPLLVKWKNDFEVRRTMAPPFRPTTLETEEAWYKNASESEHTVHFAVYELATMRPIGYTDLAQINYFHRTAELGLVIGVKDCWNKGYGTEIAKLMVDYGFSALGIHNIILQAACFNERGLRAYLRAGFKEVGRRREALRLGSQAYDIVYMDRVSDDLESGAMRRHLPE